MAPAKSAAVSGKVTLKVSPAKLRAILFLDKQEVSPSPEAKAIADSVTAMAPPAKKGVKRSAPGANGEVRDRKKPGPKKKKLDDGEPRPERGHKLGPKANQGAINAGLRALDRTGKPCRRWVKASFTLKSFTGVTWEINRWATGPKKSVDGAEETPTEVTETMPVPKKKEDGKRKKKDSDAGKKEAEAEENKEEKKKERMENGDVEMADAPEETKDEMVLPKAVTAN